MDLWFLEVAALVVRNESLGDDGADGARVDFHDEPRAVGGLPLASIRFDVCDSFFVRRPRRGVGGGVVVGVDEAKTLFGDHTLVIGSFGQ